MAPQKKSLGGVMAFLLILLLFIVELNDSSFSILKIEL